MRRIGMGCGLVLLCVAGPWMQPVFAQEEEADSSVEQVRPAVEKRRASSSDSAASGPVSVDNEGNTAAAEESAPRDAQSTSAAATTTAETPEANDAATTGGDRTAASDSADTAENTSGDRGAAVDGAPPVAEHVPEAVEPASERTGSHVDVASLPSSDEKASDGSGEILTGTWTKCVLFATRNGEFRFQPRGWIQPRFDLVVNTNDEINNDEPLEGTGFSLHRARFGFQAWLFKWGHFYLDSEWRSGKPSLVDYFVDLGPSNGDGAVNARVGYFRPFMARQSLHSTTQLSMIDYARAWTELNYTPVSDGTSTGFDYIPAPLNGRQLGIALRGLAHNGIEYGVGIWNGSDGYEADADFMYGGRLAVHPMGLAGGATVRAGDESDSTISVSPALSLGLSAYVEDRNDAVSDLPGLYPYEDFLLKSGFDMAFKYAGLSLEGEVFVTYSWAKQGVIQDALDLYHRNAPGVGGYFQVGYLVVPKRVEVIARMDVADENVEIRGIRFYPTAGMSYFLFGNNLKAQFQYRANVGAGYEEADPLHTPITHDVIFLLQASI